MANQEEVLLRMGMDNSGFAQGLSGGLNSLKEFGHRTHEEFAALGLAGRGFHKVLEQVKDISPGMGEALKFALNPVVAIAGAAVGIFVKFKEHIAEVNAELDKMAAFNAKSIFGAEQIRAARHEVEALDEEYQKFQQHRAPKAGEDLVERVNEETDSIKKLHAAYTSLTEAQAQRSKAENEQRQTLEKRKEMTADLTRSTELLKTKEEQIKTAEEAFTKAGGQEKYNELEVALRNAEKFDQRYGGAAIALAHSQFEQIKKLSDNLGLAKGRLEQLKNEQEAINTLLHIASSNYEDAATKVKAYDEVISHLGTSIKKLKDPMSEKAETERKSVEEKARTGSYFDPVAQAARQFTQKGAAEQTPSAYAAARKILAQAGLITPELFGGTTETAHQSGIAEDQPPRGSYRLSASRDGKTLYDTGVVEAEQAKAERLKSGSFRLSAKGLGEPHGLETVFTKMDAHLEKIAGAVDGRYFKVKPENAP